MWDNIIVQQKGTKTVNHSNFPTFTLLWKFKYVSGLLETGVPEIEQQITVGIICMLYECGCGIMSDLFQLALENKGICSCESRVGAPTAGHKVPG